MGYLKFGGNEADLHKKQLAETESDRHHSLGVVEMNQLPGAIGKAYATGLELHKVHSTCLDGRQDNARACLVFKPQGYNPNASFEVDSYHLLLNDVVFENGPDAANLALSANNLEQVSWQTNGLIYYISR